MYIDDFKGDAWSKKKDITQFNLFRFIWVHQPKQVWHYQLIIIIITIINIVIIDMLFQCCFSTLICNLYVKILIFTDYIAVHYDIIRPSRFPPGKTHG